MRKMTTFKKTLKAFIVLMLFTPISMTAFAQYVVDFEGTGEVSTAYPAETVNLSGLNWQVGPEVQIGDAANDFKNGNRSARMRARNGSVLEMVQDKADGIGEISFVYRRYNNDNDQQPWYVEYSDNAGANWIKLDSITGTATPQNFQKTVNVEGNVRIRIRLATTPGTGGDRRMNVDDITITDYIANAPILSANPTALSGFTYEENNGASTAQTFTVTGNNLVGTGNISVTSTANYEVSTDGTSYSASVNLPFDLGVITGSNTVYVRQIAGLTAGVYSGTITVDGGGASTVTITANGTVNASLYPSVFDLSSGNYSFTAWNDNSASYTYPANMRFWTASTDAVSLTELPVGNYTGTYNLTSASRINGLNQDGVSFIATGSAGAGFPLGAVVGINTTGKENIQVSWTGGLITQGAGLPTPRAYGLRLQYQVGQGSTWTDVAGQIEYLSAGQTDGHEEVFAPTTLPATCNNQSEVYLRWVYHFIAQNDGGSRPNIRLDEILVSGNDITNPSIQTSVSTLNGFDQTLGTPSAEKSFTVSGTQLSEDIAVSVSGEYEVSLTSGSGFASAVTVAQTSGTANSTTIYVRLNSTTVGAKTGTITTSSLNASNVVVNLNGQTSEEIVTPPNNDTLLYYWHFNNMTNTADVTEITADYSYLPNFDGKFTYTDPIEGARDIDRYATGSSINLQQGEVEGYAARVRNPSTTRSLVFDVPTTGAEEIGFQYAVQRSGSGMLHNIVQYSVDGTNFISTDLTNDTLEVVGDEVWQLFTFDFSTITSANNNPNFKLKITWFGNTTASNGNNRYDNITLTAKSIKDDVSVKSISEITEINVYPNPFDETVSISVSDNIQTIQIIDLQGKVIKSIIGNNANEQQISTNDLVSGTYFFVINTTKGVFHTKLIKA